MSINNMTTTRNGFKVQDITFRGARKQSEIDKEIEHEEPVEQEVKAPVSLTPEQIKDFYTAKIKASHDSNEKRVYSHTIKCLDELVTLRKRVLQYEEKERQREENEADVDVSAIDAES